MGFSRFLKDCLIYKDTLILFITPFIFLPILFTIGYPSGSDQANSTANVTTLSGPPARCLYCVLLMAVFWMFEVLPLAVTALMPIFLFPMLNIMQSKKVCQNYLTDTNFLFVGGLIVAVAVEKSNLHQRIALRVLTIVGSKPHWIMLGFMTVTAFLSMWISNTATTAMMVPIAESVISELLKYSIASKKKYNDNGDIAGNGEVSESVPLESGEDDAIDVKVLDGTNEANNEAPEDPDHIDLESVSPSEQKVAKGLLMCICFAANIGGTGTVTGTPPNLVMMGQMKENLYPGQDTGLSFASWMGFSIPPMFLSLIATWACLVLYFIGFRIFTQCCRGKKQETRAKDGGVEAVINAKYRNLPPWSFAEIEVLICFLILLSMWIFRKQSFGKLFNPYVPATKKRTPYFTDATSAIIIAVLLFALPMEKPDFLCFRGRDRSRDPVKRAPIMDWASMQSKFAWSVVILLGGGFALAAGVKESGLSNWVGMQLQRLGSLSTVGVQFVCVIITMIVTNITSNTVTASIFVPIVNGLALKIGTNPLALIIPTTLACSYAFLLPVATPPNAIVFASGMLKVGDMMASGALVSVISVLLIVLYSQTYIDWILGMNSFPEWALSSVQNVTLRRILAEQINSTIT